MWFAIITTLVILYIGSRMSPGMLLVAHTGYLILAVLGIYKMWSTGILHWWGETVWTIHSAIFKYIATLFQIFFL